MTLYWVKVNAEPLHVNFDGVEELCGFYKNEFVFAKTTEAAKLHAIRKVEDDLRTRKEVRVADLPSLRVNAESANPTWRVWRAFWPGGYIFYPMDENASASSEDQ